jgi:hypothetical protein
MVWTPPAGRPPSKRLPDTEPTRSAVSEPGGRALKQADGLEGRHHRAGGEPRSGGGMPGRVDAQELHASSREGPRGLAEPGTRHRSAGTPSAGR